MLQDENIGIRLKAAEIIRNEVDTQPYVTT